MPVRFFISDGGFCKKAKLLRHDFLVDQKRVDTDLK